MQVMNPYYAHESSVGDVFDVATWSGARAVRIGMVALVFGPAMLAAALLAFRPEWFLGQPQLEVFFELLDDLRQAQTDYPWAFGAGIGVVALFGWFATGAGIAALCNARGNYYLRCGAQGVALRVPLGVDWRKAFLAFETLELEVPWSEVTDLTVTQEKQFGALSRNAGNIGGWIDLVLRNGKKHTFDVGLFEQPAWLIHERIREAQSLVAWRAEEAANPEPAGAGA